MSFFEMTPVTDEYDSALKDVDFGRGVVVPFMSFDPDLIADMKDRQKRSVDTGALPMAFLGTKGDDAFPVLVKTHDTPATKALDEIKAAILNGELPPDAYFVAYTELQSGSFDRRNYLPDAP